MMMPRKLAALLVGLFALGVTGRAEAVPQTVSFTGRLSTMSGPVTGSVNLTFKLYDVATGGTAVWTEVRNGVGANNGLVFVDLGQVTTLDSSMFTGIRMYLEVTVGAEVLSPRMAINSVPYAMQTDNSQTLGGTITAADVITTAAGANGVTATKTGNALAVSLVTSGCMTGQAFKYNGTGFACAADADTPPVAGAGINVTGNTVSLATTGCLAGYVWKYNGSAWACALDANTSYTAGAGINITGTTVALATTGCLANYVWKYNGMAWACALDADTTYTASSTSGITIAGTAISVDPTDFSAPPGQVALSTSVLVDTDYSTGETVIQVSINAPVAGSVLVIFTGLGYCNSCASGTTEYVLGYYTISNSATATAISGDYTYMYMRAAPAGSVTDYATLAAQDVFSVAAGTNTFYLRAGRSGTTETYYMARARISAIFIPQ